MKLHSSLLPHFFLCSRKLKTSQILTETPEKKDPQPPVAHKKIRFNEEVLEEEEICSGPNEENDFKSDSSFSNFLSSSDEESESSDSDQLCKLTCNSVTL